MPPDASGGMQVLLREPTHRAEREARRAQFGLVQFKIWPGRRDSPSPQKVGLVTRSPPAVFERYMAASARCIRSSTSSPGCTSTTPTLAVTPLPAPTAAPAPRGPPAGLPPGKGMLPSARAANPAPPPPAPG